MEQALYKLIETLEKEKYEDAKEYFKNIEKEINDFSKKDRINLYRTMLKFAYINKDKDFVFHLLPLANYDEDISNLFIDTPKVEPFVNKTDYNYRKTKRLVRDTYDPKKNVYRISYGNRFHDFTSSDGKSLISVSTYTNDEAQSFLAFLQQTYKDTFETFVYKSGLDKLDINYTDEVVNKYKIRIR